MPPSLTIAEFQAAGSDRAEVPPVRRRKSGAACGDDTLAFLLRESLKHAKLRRNDATLVWLLEQAAKRAGIRGTR
jgi:hypothetical protein